MNEINTGFVYVHKSCDIVFMKFVSECSRTYLSASPLNPPWSIFFANFAAS